MKREQNLRAFINKILGEMSEIIFGFIGTELTMYCNATKVHIFVIEINGQRIACYIWRNNQIIQKTTVHIARLHSFRFACF